MNKYFYALLCFPILIIHRLLFPVQEKGYRVSPKYKDGLELHEVGTVQFGRN